MAAGQSSTLTGTYAGQFIMGGFLDLRMKKWLRSLITRSCAIIPTIIVAVVYNRSDASLDNLNEWLNVLQVRSQCSAFTMALLGINFDGVKQGDHDEERTQ
ncbi:hypothetical protein ACET3Z_032837 [Daucus carota]